MSAQTSPPWQVVSAIYLLGAELGLAVVRSILMKDWSRPIPATLGVLVLAAVCSLWLYGLWRRRNWLRWFTVISGTVGCAFAYLDVTRLNDIGQVRLYWLQFALTVPVVIILVLPVAREWYSSRNLAVPSA